MTMRRTIPALALFLLLTTTARASDIPCALVEKGTIQLDGLLGDWKGVDGVGVDQATNVLRGRRDWSGPQDLSFDVYCNHDANNLYLAVNVKDEYFVRTKKVKGDDHIVVWLGGRQLVVYPGDLRYIKSKMTWGRRGRVKGIRMAEAMQRGGYSVELRLPFKQLPRFRKGSPAYRGAVWVADSDSKAKMRTETTMGTASARRGQFSFARARANLGLFLKDKGYSMHQVRARYHADVVGDKGIEQVVLVGKTIGIVGDNLPGGSYFYLDLAVRNPRDIYWLKPKDLNGDRKQELVTRYVERSGNGRREIIAVFRFNDSNQFIRSFAHEILKGQGKRMIVNRFRFKPFRGRRGKRGVDMIFDKPVARGFSQETYREAPTTDFFSILLPWGTEKKRHFRFEGEEYFQK